MLALRAMNEQPPQFLRLLSIVLLLLILAACAPTPQPDAMHIVLIADGRQRAYVHDQQISVGQFLEQVGVTLGELDRVVPPKVTQIAAGTMEWDLPEGWTRAANTSAMRFATLNAHGNRPDVTHLIKLQVKKSNDCPQMKWVRNHLMLYFLCNVVLYCKLSCNKVLSLLVGSGNAASELSISCVLKM